MFDPAEVQAIVSELARSPLPIPMQGEFRANAMFFSLQPLFVAAGFQDMAPKMVWSLSGKSIHLRMLADTRTKLGL